MDLSRAVTLLRRDARRCARCASRRMVWTCDECGPDRRVCLDCKRDYEIGRLFMAQATAHWDRAIAEQADSEAGR